MRFQQVNRTNAEVAYGVGQNVAGATISGNYPVCFTTTSGSNDGYQVVEPAAANLFTFAGICNADTSDTEVMNVQVYGYRDSVRIFAHGTSVTTGAGVVIGPGAGSSGLSSTGALDTFGPVVAMEAIGAAINSPGGYAKGWIRAL